MGLANTALEMQDRAIAAEARVRELEGALRRIEGRVNAQFTLPSVQPITPAELLGIVQGALKGKGQD